MTRKKENSYAQQQKFSGIFFLNEFPNFLIMLFFALSSNSLLVWLDLIDCLSNSLHAGFIYLLSRKLKGNLHFKYNYGIGKIESASTILCDLIIMPSLCITILFAVKGLIDPVHISNITIYIILLKLLNVSIDAYFLIKQLHISKKNRTPVQRNSIVNLQKNLAFDTVVFVSLLAILVFDGREFSYYISPVVSLCIAIYFIVRKFLDFRKTMVILMDETLGEVDQIYILKVLATYYDHYVQVKEIKTRQSGDSIYIDLALEFDPSFTYADMLSLISSISRDLDKTIPNCFVNFLIYEDVQIENNL